MIMEIVELTEEQKVDLEAALAHRHFLLKKAAEQILGEDSPAAIKRLRRVPDLPETVIRIIEEINEMAPQVDAQYIRVVLPLVKAYHVLTAQKCKGLEEDDFLQEAHIAIFDAMFTYNGRTRFSTYVYHCVKRHLASSQNQEIKAGSVRCHVKRLGRSVQSLMRKGVSLQMALAYAGERACTGKKHHHVDEDNPCYVEQESVEPGTWDEYQEEEIIEKNLQLRAIVLAPLNPLERGLIDAYMAGDKKVFRDGTCNPATGKPYTRQGVLNAYHTAKDKIRVTYDRLLQQQAVA